MRIALVDPGHQLPGYCHALVSALARAGAETTFVSAPLLHYAAQAAPGVRVHPAFGRLLGREGTWLRRLAGRARIRRLLRALAYPLELAAFVRWADREGIDLVHLQWSLAPPLDALALRALRRRGIATVYTIHNALPHEARPWHAPAYRLLYASADRLVLHSQATEKRILRDLGPPGPPLERMDMPADPVPPAGDRRAARRRLELPLDRPLLLFFGHVRPYKGLELLLEAWPRVAAARPEARLLIAGNTAGGPAQRAALGARIAAAGADSILWRPGFVPSDAAPDYFAAADLIALPYLDSDHSAVATAARGYGRAVVATAVGGLPEALAGGGGLLVPPADPEAMAAGILGLLDHPERREALEAEALTAARAWTWDDAARLSLEIYARALAEPRLGQQPKAESTSDSDSKSTPLVSIILPVRDEAPHIAATLEALLRADFPPERMEILVIDGASRDATRAIAQGLAEADPWSRLRLLDNPAGITPAGLNLGIRAARGEFILRMDGHARPAPDYIPACLRALERPGVWAVGGRMQGRGETGFGRAVALATAHPLGAGDAAFRIGGEGPVDTVYLGAWPRWVFDRVGFFDEGLPRNQDYELCLRIRAAGGLVWLDPAIRSQSLCRGSLPALARQYFGYGRGRAATWRRHPRSLRLRQVLPALWVAGLLLGPVAAGLVPALRAPLLATLAGYVLVLLLTTLRLSSRAGRDSFHLPWVFACIHLSWGLGFWWELLARGRGFEEHRP